MSSIMHATRTVCSTANGGWIYKPGSKGGEIGIVIMARANVAKAKYMGSRPASHSISIDYVGNASECRSFVDKISGYYDGKVGTLSVPEYGSTPNCVFTGAPSISEVGS